MHAVHERIEGVFVPDAEIPEQVAHPAIEIATEGAAAAKLVLVDPALAFMHAHRHPLPRRGQKEFWVDALLIAGMADLVDRRVEAVERIILGGAGGDAHVFARPAGERMNRPVDATPGQVIAEGFCQFPAKRHLRIGVERSRKRRHLRGVQGAFAQCHQARTHLVEHRGEFGRFAVRLEIVDQRIVKVAVARQRRGLFPLELDHLGQRGKEGGHVVLGTRGGPYALRPAGQPGQRGGQIGRHLDRPLIAAADQPQLRGAVRVGRVGLLQPLRDLRVGAHGMQHAFHRAAFLGPLPGRAAGHHGFLIPAQPR